MQTPICIASTAFQKLANPFEGELGMARAGENYKHTPILVSSWSTYPCEEIAAYAPNSVKIF